MIAARRRPICRARLVLVRDGPAGREVLLTHHRHPDRTFWCFPGGGVEPGESFGAAAQREAREETGLTVALDGVSFVHDRPTEDAVECFYAARVIGGEARLGMDPERDGAGPAVLDGLRWVPLARLPGLGVLPMALAQALADGSYFSWGLLPPA